MCNLYLYVHSGAGELNTLSPLSPDLCAVPKTMRLVEGGRYVVELVNSHCWDVTPHSNVSAVTNHAVLTRTGVDGSQKTVNVLSLAKEHLKWAKHVCSVWHTVH